MDQQQIEKLLMDSLDDFRLDNEETVLFRELVESLRDDQIGYVRNKSFEISRQLVEQGGDVAVKTHNWLARIVKILQSTQDKTIPDSQAYFSPGTVCRNKIINLIDMARQKIDICVFTISDNKITHAIHAAHKRGIKVTLISDNDKANDMGSDVYELSTHGINVILDQSSYHMHHKFAIIDNAVLINGSFNWTRSASDYNEENIVVSYEPVLIEQFAKQFSELKRELTDL